MAGWSASERRSDVVFAVLGIGLGGLGGLLLTERLVLGGALLAVCLLVAFVATRPVALALIAVAGSFAAARAGAGGGLPVGGNGVSYADVTLAVATAFAVPSLVAGPEARRIRGPLIGLAVYLACLLPAVVPDDSTRGWFEWGHRLVLVGGAIAVGAWITKEGRGRTALRILLVVACGIALLAVQDTLRRGLEPAYPIGLNKNFVGAQLSMALIVLVTARRQLDLNRWIEPAAVVVVAAGLIASQSRGGMLAAAVGIVFAVGIGTGRHGRGFRAIIFAVVVVLAGFVYFSLRADFSESAADFNNNSIGVRQQVEERTLEIWRTSPVFGVGLKYFNSGEYGELAQAPNIVVDNELAESGLVGLGGFVVLQGAAVVAVVRRRRDDRLVVVGGACVLAALTHGMVDIYWIAGSVSLPFLVLGMGLATGPVDRTVERRRGGRVATRGGAATPAAGGDTGGAEGGADGRRRRQQVGSRRAL